MASRDDTEQSPLTASTLEDLIEQRRLKPGDRVGAERELAEHFGVSRWVVRKVVAELEARGEVIRITKGRSGGIYVAPQKVVRDLSELVGLPAYLQQQGVTAGTTVLGSRVRAADEDLADHLDIDVGAWAFQIDRLRLADGLPLSVETCCFPSEMFPNLLDHSLTGSLYDLLDNEYGAVRGEAVETVTAAAADHEQSTMLRIPLGHPLLLVTRVARLESGVVFEYSHESYRADRVALVVSTSGGNRSTLQLS